MNIRFKKKDLRLNEDAFTDVSNNARQNPSGRANAPLGDFTDSNNDGQTKITVNPNDSNAKANLKKVASALGPEETKKTSVEIDTDKPTTESLDAYRNMLESVEFTKGELTSWLKTL